MTFLALVLPVLVIAPEIALAVQLVFPTLPLLFWDFTHNCVAHPLLFFTSEAAWAIRFHDWTWRAPPWQGPVMDVNERTRDARMHAPWAIVETRDGEALGGRIQRDTEHAGFWLFRDAGPGTELELNWLHRDEVRRIRYLPESDVRGRVAVSSAT